ncbi:MAG: threonine synthase, partial [Erysipelotrichaceae bacterium]|nr:threonine synthase [Erysipelotrichaceae bacterium]
MTNFISTRNIQNIKNSKQAIIQGLAEDGGLFVPEKIDRFNDIYALKDLSYKDLALEIIHSIFNDLDKEELRKVINSSYNKFDTEEITPLSKVNDDYFLELFHGPTCAFKDVALQFLPNILTMCNEDDKDIVILSATSGDTGKAALEGFKDVKGTKIKVLYPYKMVSEVQEKQMSTTGGNNTEVLAVKGNFDDCQRMVKETLENEKFDNIHLTSANSINIARLVPQIVYYFKAYFTLLNNEEIIKDEKIDFVVPTGNFGDILAGYIASLMGLPVGKLVCASNKNNVLTEFINTGVYKANREFFNTMAPSIDILVSSNLERLLFLKSKDDKLVEDLMKKLKEDKVYQISDELLNSIQKDFIAFDASEEEAEEVIERYYKEDNYLLDTHTAVAVVAA